MMKTTNNKTLFDYIVVGASVAGNVFCQNIKGNKMVLMIDKAEYGRYKSCSGIQFRYVDKLLSRKIPDHVLCTNQIDHVEFFVNGRRFRGKYPLLNFHRDRFDKFLTDETSKLNNIEIHHNEFFKTYERDNETIVVETDKNVYRCKFLIDASGLRSPIRKIDGKDHGGTLNSYYSVESSDLDKNTCYQFYDDRSDAMFSWVYFKDDLLCIGNGMKNMDFASNARSFRDDVLTRFNVKGKLVKEEGYSAPLLPVKLRDGSVFFIGDAAGLLSLERGVGIDIAIKSALNLARLMNETSNVETIEHAYLKRMHKEIASATSQNNQNVTMLKMLRRGLGMFINSIHNRFSEKYNYRLN